MRALVLAAGFATRLYPLTRDRAKPLLEVADRPVLSHVLDRVQALPGLRGIVVVTNARFHAQFEAWRASYPCRVPIEVLDDGATDDDHRLGALADLALALRALPDDADEEILVLAGDNLLEFELDGFHRTFLEHGDPILLCRRIDGGVPPGRHGEVCLGADGVVESFREKPMDPRSDLAATCLYFFPARTARDLAEYLRTHDDHDAPGHFLAWLAEHRRLRAMQIPGRMFDIGNRESLERARREYRP